MMKSVQAKELDILAHILHRPTQSVRTIPDEEIGCAWHPKKRVWSSSYARVAIFVQLAVTLVLGPMAWTVALSRANAVHTKSLMDRVMEV
jgi:hypothetical protein